ncbi:MAG TPA: glutamate racemase [Chloroflexota bacterium]|nr:glutamate racemase [Chloroflexota bacterium]
MDTRPIGFFDSGIGGLSILRATRRLLPAESMIYLADNAHFPYGALPAEALRSLAVRLTRFLLARDAKLIVVACNTVTVHALAHLRAAFPEAPFVGVVPVVKPLAERTRNRVIAVLVTPATAESPYLARLIDEYASACKTVTIPCPGLADLVEAGRATNAELDCVLEQSLAPARASGADMLGLGCTHYPFLRARVQRLVGPDVRIIDSGGAVARRVRAVLAAGNALAGTAPPSYSLYSTGDPDALARAARRYIRLPATMVERVTLPGGKPRVRTNHLQHLGAAGKGG